MAEDEDQHPTPSPRPRPGSETAAAIGDDVLLALTDKGREALRLIGDALEA